MIAINAGLDLAPNVSLTSGVRTTRKMGMGHSEMLRLGCDTPVPAGKSGFVKFSWRS